MNGWGLPNPGGWSVYDVRDGDVIEVKTAHGDWIAATALGRVQQGDRFPIVWVDTTGGSRTPWPIESIRPAERLSKGI